MQNETFTLEQYINAVVYTFGSSASRFLPRDSSDEGGDDQHGLDDIDGEEELPHELRCSICLRRRERTVVLLPCRHAASCASCIGVIMEAADENNPAKCPTCRNIIQDRLEVFI